MSLHFHHHGGGDGDSGFFEEVPNILCVCQKLHRQTELQLEVSGHNYVQFTYLYSKTFCTVWLETSTLGTSSKGKRVSSNYFSTFLGQMFWADNNSQLQFSAWWNCIIIPFLFIWHM